MPSSVELWSRRLHTHIGLFLLFFLWLFTLSGIVLNHPKWRFAEFWSVRSEISRELRIVPLTDTGGLAVCRDLLQQMGIRGEISGRIHTSVPTLIAFRVVRPGDIYDITAHLDTGLATVRQIHLNGWGVVNMLHSFSGVRRSDPSLHQNWWATDIWRLSMDVLSVGLILIVLSGICLWFIKARFRLWGTVALFLGIFTLGILLST